MLSFSYLQFRLSFFLMSECEYQSLICPRFCFGGLETKCLAVSLYSSTKALHVVFFEYVVGGLMAKRGTLSLLIKLPGMGLVLSSMSSFSGRSTRSCCERIQIFDSCTVVVLMTPSWPSAFQLCELSGYEVIMYFPIVLLPQHPCVA